MTYAWYTGSDLPRGEDWPSYLFFGLSQYENFLFGGLVRIDEGKKYKSSHGNVK